MELLSPDVRISRLPLQQDEVIFYPQETKTPAVKAGVFSVHKEKRAAHMELLSPDVRISRLPLQQQVSLPLLPLQYELRR